jgi:hypothetical protein
VPLLVRVLLVGADADVTDYFWFCIGVENSGEKKWYSMKIILLQY